MSDSPEIQDSAQSDDAARSALDRILAADETHAGVRVFGSRATALQDESTADGGDRDGEQFDREERAALRRVAGLSTELDDVTEVEYRQVRLENVVLIGVYTRSESVEDAENSMRELAALGADTVVADTELAPSQRRALEDAVKVKVLDRTAVILDIFSTHAKSREGKAQVELAQLEYLLPRLRGWGESMSRQAGGQAAGGQGMGSRGPGETKIELDRRRINSRISKLKREIG